MLRALGLFLIFAILNSAHALEGLSAKRAPGVSYRIYLLAAQLRAQSGDFSTADGKTAVDSSFKYGTQTLPPAAKWESETMLLANFAKVRDYRFIPSPGQPEFLRRISWLYPDDGCFARASLAVLNLETWKAAAPNKIYVFGDLVVKTANSPTGEVSWWYHVAPMVEVGGVNYVLDPAIDPKQPMKVDEWLHHMSPDPSVVDVAVCGSGSYTPYDLCDKASDGIEKDAGQDQIGFLTSEYLRIQDLGRNPVDELGDKPPWKMGSVLGFR